MGQSLSQLYVHLTFGTYNRYPFIQTNWESQLYGYMSGILKNYESPVIEINSVSDHIHILFRLSKNVALAKVVENAKKDSSKWIKANTSTSKFSWQAGYGAFSVSSSKLEAVSKYILKQKEHHRKLTYKQEVEKFTKEYGIIEYDDTYFWR